MSDVPIIMLTAQGVTRRRAWLSNLAADDYVTKPFRVKEFVARVGPVYAGRGTILSIRTGRLSDEYLTVDLDSAW